MSVEVFFEPGNQLEIDAAGLTVAINAGCDPEQLKSSRVLVGVRPVEAGELFSFATAMDTDSDLVMRGDWSRARNVGAGMWNCCIDVHSSVGDGAGRMMSGGILNVFGDSGDDLGQGMTGGLIRISGDARHRVAGPMSGQQLGANGGTIFVGGNAGSHAAMGLRRGNVVINGNCGELAGYEMRGGNLVIVGHTADQVGRDMRRGLILLLSPLKSTPSGFKPCGQFSPVFTSLLWRELTKLGWNGTMKMPIHCDFWGGDRLHGCRGEIVASQLEETETRLNDRA